MASTRDTLRAVHEQVARVVLGQDAVISGVLVGLLAGGHVLLEGVPGTAKTLLVRALAVASGLQTSRVQFTPDLMPSDVTGSLVYDQHGGEFSFRPGPVLTNLLNPIEYEGTYPLPEAQLDRFLLMLTVPLPDARAEAATLTAHAPRSGPSPEAANRAVTYSCRSEPRR